MKAIKKTTNRRNFLLAAGLGGAGVAAAVVARSPEVTAKVAEGEATRSTGYQASAHVQKYYKTTDV